MISLPFFKGLRVICSPLHGDVGTITHTVGPQLLLLTVSIHRSTCINQFPNLGKIAEKEAKLIKNFANQTFIFNDYFLTIVGF